MNFIRMVVLIASASLFTDGMRAQIFTTLHNFDGSSGGASPRSILVVSSNVIYGTTFAGGSTGKGVVFSMNTNGTGYQVLHTFAGGLDGAQPYSGLLLSSNTLYGSASSTIDHLSLRSANGVLYSLGTDGTRFTVLHRFSGLISAPYPYLATNTDGALPYGPLILWSNLLYGTAMSGGSAGGGTLFALKPDGNGFRTLHSFVEETDGERPNGALIPFGEKLYGAAQGEDALDAGDQGAVFSISPDGSGFTLLHRLGGGGNNFLYGLDQTNNALFGVTSRLGTPDSPLGNVFKMELGGSFTNLHTFACAPSSITNYDGTEPALGALAFDGIRLYGANSLGGFAASGTIYSLKPDGSAFTVLYTFTGGDDGGEPEAAVTLSGNTLYGTTYIGGKYGYGTIFSIALVPIPLPTITKQPSSRTNLAGSTAMFSIAATGQAPLSYQWLKSTNLIAQQISPTLTLTNVSDKDGGVYSVIVSNGGGSVVSAPAYLVVLDLPTITTQPHSRTNIAGSAASFNVVATGSGSLGYQWFKGANALARQVGPTLILTNVTDADAASYSVVVTNSVGKTTSTAAMLVVLDPPRITRQPMNQTNLAGANATFNVSATGTPPLSYQWLRNNSPLPQQRSPSLTLLKVSDGDAASYSVVVTNSAGTVISASATLTVIDLPTLSAQRVADSALVLWPTGLTGFTLQWTTNLGALSWETNSAPPVIVNGQNTVTIPFAGGQRFLRLRK